MSTRSAIALEINNTQYLTIYCHWDGYPAGVGYNLFNYYNSTEKVLALLALGNISSLYKNLNPTGPHTFAEPQKDVTIAYIRDRGEDQESEEAKIYTSWREMDWAEYIYIWSPTNKKWSYMRAGDGHLLPLTQSAVENERG